MAQGSVTSAVAVNLLCSFHSFLDLSCVSPPLSSSGEGRE